MVKLKKMDARFRALVVWKIVSLSRSITIRGIHSEIIKRGFVCDLQSVRRDIRLFHKIRLVSFVQDDVSQLKTYKAIVKAPKPLLE